MGSRAEGRGEEISFAISFVTSSQALGASDEVLGRARNCVLSMGAGRELENNRNEARNCRCARRNGRRRDQEQIGYAYTCRNIALLKALGINGNGVTSFLDLRDQVAFRTGPIAIWLTFVVGRQAAAKARALAAGSHRYWVTCRPIESMVTMCMPSNS